MAIYLKLEMSQFLNRYLTVGPPVYFVIQEGLDYTNYDEQNLVCSLPECDPYSVMNQIFIASLINERYDW